MTELAKAMRKNPTEAEDLMWKMLRDKFSGFSFRRQHPISIYIADFVCITKKLIIEVDGGYHSTEQQMEEDKQRTEVLKAKGFTVIRFTNEEVVANTEQVLEKIRKFLVKELI